MYADTSDAAEATRAIITPLRRMKAEITRRYYAAILPAMPAALFCRMRQH